MSGGRFDYVQYKIEQSSVDIDAIIKGSDDYSEETINKLTEASELLAKSAKMLQRVDWLVSGDDGEESFHRRWKEDGLEKS